METLALRLTLTACLLFVTGSQLSFSIYHQTVCQANAWRITAFGGFYLVDGERVYPGIATMDRTPENNWGEWKKEEERDNNQRSGFMHAEVPLSWIHCICDE